MVVTDIESNLYGLRKRIYFPNEIIENGERRYEIQRILGDGLSGIVYQCNDLEKELNLAIKMVYKKELYYNRGTEEISINKSLNNLSTENRKNLLTPINIFLHNDSYFMVFEIFEMSLFDYIHKTSKFGPIEKDKIKNIMKQILEGVYALKSADIIHCDIKLENILVDPRTLRTKICDFGLSCFNSPKIKRRIGTRLYSSPEVFKGLEYSFPRDMWAVGCVFFELVAFKYLFYRDGKLSVFDIVNTYLKEVEIEGRKEAVAPFLDSVKIDLKRVDGAYDFLTAIIKENPEDRLTPGKALKKIETL
eukprot:GHVP01010536.1.p1 GENE.GHVP01010536.1~~GHVP01010536.1.p1  ORF type:complete len:305 (+),score=53.48 GHVP01010536.1:1119-2033(+)